MLAGHRVELVLRLARPGRRTRTDRQNAYYWGVVLEEFADFLGDTRDELHEALKFKFLGLENPDGRLPRVRSTASLTPKEFTFYIERVVHLAVDYGCYITPPEPRD